MIASMEGTHRDKLLSRINRKDWWHVPPSDPDAYEKRGMFLASTFREAEFWGRPLDTPIRVNVLNPIIGDESAIQNELGVVPPKPPGDGSPKLLDWRWKLDAKMKQAALARGYDAIVLLSPSGYAKLIGEGRLPLSIELNLLHGQASAARKLSGHPK
jgi:hypothetical protein